MSGTSRLVRQERGIEPVMELFQLNDRFIRLHIVTLGSQNHGDSPIDRRRHLAFHLHRFDDQQRIAGLDAIVDRHQDFHHSARHGRRHITWFRRSGAFGFPSLFTLLGLRDTGEHFLDGFERHFFEFIVDTDVVRLTSVDLST